ncbi:phosphotransferase [Arthrobacter psychrolactophilus]
MEEITLSGGNASHAVVRLGSTVRKPWTATTATTHDYLSFLANHGLDVPASYGQDSQGRQILEFIPGDLAMDAPPLSLAELQRVGRLVRSIHDASASYHAAPNALWPNLIPAPGAELICHNDLAPWNLVLGERWVFIDWDAAAPSTRLWDLAYSAQAFTLNDASTEPHTAARSLLAFLEGYGADEEMRQHLPNAMWQRTEAMYTLLKNSHAQRLEPWGTMFTSGHGEHWETMTRYVRENEPVWREALRTAAPGAAPL